MDGYRPDIDMPVRSIYGRPAFRGGRALSYLEVTQVIKLFWERLHPDIPLQPYQGSQNAVYPSVIYRLETRAPADNEPKPRLREDYTIRDGIVTKGQRFMNIVSFAAYTKNDPIAAEMIIDDFEDFMDAMIPAFKANGVQEIFYNRRIQESSDDREDRDVNVHTVFYNITTEKLTLMNLGVLEEIVIDVRTWVDHTRHQSEIEPATPNGIIESNIVDQYRDLATPNTD